MLLVFVVETENRKDKSDKFSILVLVLNEK
jgi:hypothetical protein